MAKPARKTSSKKLVKVKNALRTAAKDRSKRQADRPTVKKVTEVIEISTDDEAVEITQASHKASASSSKTTKSRVVKVETPDDVVIDGDGSACANDDSASNASESSGPTAPTMAVLFKRYGFTGPSDSKRAREESDDEHPVAMPKAKRRSSEATKQEKLKANRDALIAEVDGDQDHYLSVLHAAMAKSRDSGSAKGKKFLARLKDTIANDDVNTSNPFIDDEAMEVDEGYGSGEEPTVDSNGYDVGDGFVVPDDEVEDNDSDKRDSSPERVDDENDSDERSSDDDVTAPQTMEDNDDDHDSVLDTHARRAARPTTIDDMINPSGAPVLRMKKPLGTAKEIMRLRKEVTLGNLANGKQINSKTSKGQSRVLAALDEYMGEGTAKDSSSTNRKQTGKLLAPIELAPKTKKKSSAKEYITPLGTKVQALEDGGNDDEFDEEEAQNFLRARVASLKAAAGRSKSTSRTTASGSSANSTSSQSTSNSGNRTTLQQLVALQSSGGRQMGEFTPSGNVRSGGAVVEGPHGWLYDTEKRRTVKYPSVNEVGDTVVVRGIMAPIYAKCPPLLKGVLIPWLKAKGAGLARFDAWVSQCPTMSAELVFSAMAFVRLADVVNPTHIDVRLLYAEEVVGGNSRSFIFIDGHVATFMSSVYVEYSQLTAASTVGLKIKSLRGIFHEMDYQRFVGVVAMTFNEFRLHAQLARDAVQFVTRGPSRKFGKGKSKAVSDMFNGESSTVDGEAVGNVVHDGETYALEATAEIPVYDARAHADFDFTTDIGNRDELLPRWADGEVPRGSFAVVGYTVNTYLNQDGETTLSLNIMWVIVCGTPGSQKTASRVGGDTPKTFTMADLNE